MALGNNDRNFTTRLRIGTRVDEKGKTHAVVGVRCKEDEPGARPILKADGTHVANKTTGELLYRLEYDFVYGTITAMTITEDDWGKYLDVTINDGGTTYTLRLDRGDRYWTDFLLRLPMLDLTKPITFTPYNFKSEEGKTQQGIAMKQAGQKIARKWTKENDYAGGPPQAEFDEDEQEWKFGKRNRWLEENVVTPAIATLSKSVEPVASGTLTNDPPAKYAPPVAGQQGADEDDLPF
jgi:hypothetical protein